ncbi:MAG TPA: ECF-type sigma factor [Gemmataceae bacterium]
MAQQSTQPGSADLLHQKHPALGELLLQRYAHRLIALTRKRLDRRLHGKVDPEDVVQSVFSSFCRSHDEGQWEIIHEDDLWSLLVQITVRKCHRHLEHFLAARRDVRREEQNASAAQAVIDPKTTPEEASMLADMAEAVMKRLSSDIKRRIFALSLQGYNVVEISEQVRYYKQGVERVRAEIRTLLQTMMADDRPTRD